VQLVGLGLGLFGPLETALDRVDPCLEGLLHAREDELHEHEAEHREGDATDHDLLPERQDRAVLDCCAKDHGNLLGLRGVSRPR
jgi:hypothetical protein